MLLRRTGARKLARYVQCHRGANEGRHAGKWRHPHQKRYPNPHNCHTDRTEASAFSSRSRHTQATQWPIREFRTNIEQQIEQRVALQVVQVVMGAGAGAVEPQRAGGKADARSWVGVSLSLREHLDTIGASKKPEQIVTIAHYVCEIEGQTDFSRDDIRSRFITAREPPPGNFGRDFAVALKNGWIAEVHGKKNRFYVTAKGAQAINNNFSNGKGAATRR